MDSEEPLEPLNTPEEHEQKAEVLPGRDEMAWHSSLPHSQLDLLIYLKELVKIRSRHCGHEQLAEKFGPKILGMLGALIVEYVKERIKSSSMFPFSSEELESLSGQLMAQPVTASEENQKLRPAPRVCGMVFHEAKLEEEE